MSELFFTILNMSLSGSIVIMFVMLVRLLLRRAPKKWSFLMWIAAAFRLCCPVTFGAVFSIFNLFPRAAAKASGTAVKMEYVPESVLRPAASAPAVTVIEPAPAPAPRPVSAQDVLITAAWIIWLAGILALVVYSVIAYARLKGRTAAAIRREGNVFCSDRIDSPFILGVIRPRICIPSGLGGQELSYVLEHERYHLKRGDHIIKLLSFLILAVHWFNPLCWLAFMLMSRDMEMSCDERVLSGSGCSSKAYSMTLLGFAVKDRFPSPCPVAFGESGVKSRVKNALGFKKPKLWVSALCIALSMAAILVCACGPKDNDETKPTEQPEVTASPEATSAGTDAPTPSPAVTPAADPDAVVFSNSRFEELIRAYCGYNAVITEEMLEEMTELHLTASGLSDISDVARFANLEGLDISGANIVDLSAISSLKRLTRLELRNCGLTDISALSGLDGLELLDLSGNPIADISPLAQMTSLRDVRLNGCAVEDISPLAGLNGLTELYADENLISDLEPLAGLANLERLRLNANRITDVRPLAGLTRLTQLELSGNGIGDISALASLVNMHDIELAGNSIGDIEALRGMRSLSWADLSGNDISDISALSGHGSIIYLALNDNRIASLNGAETLSELVYLELAGNSVSDITPLSGLDKLSKVILNGNSVRDISPLYGAAELGWLELDSNGFTELSQLKNLKGLRNISLRYNGIKDISALSGLKIAHLSLDGNVIPDLSPLKSLIRLEVLSLEECRINSIEVLKELHTLNGLDLSENSISRSDLRLLRQLLPECNIIGDWD